MNTATLISRLALVLACIPLLGSAGFAGPSTSAQSGHPKLSPFEMVRWNELVPEVLVGEAWWRLDAIDGVTTETISADARRMFGEDWPKRFCEDLVEVLVRGGHAPSATAVLRLTDLDDPTRTVERDVVWSTENRRRIRDARPRPGSAEVLRSPAVPRIERERASEVDPRFDALTRRLGAFESSTFESNANRLTRDQAAQDLAQLEWLVEHAYAYKDRVGFDYRTAFDALHARLGDSIARASFALQIHRLLCGFGDGHTRVRTAKAELLLPGVLPVALVRDRNGVVATAPTGLRCRPHLDPTKLPVIRSRLENSPPGCPDSRAAGTVRMVPHGLPLSHSADSSRDASFP